MYLELDELKYLCFMSKSLCQSDVLWSEIAVEQLEA